MPFRAKTFQIGTITKDDVKTGHSPQHTYTLNQTLVSRLIPSISITEDMFPNALTGAMETKRFLHLDLTTSDVGVDNRIYNPKFGEGRFDQDDSRGYYVEFVCTKVWLQEPNAKAPHPDWTIRVEAPTTENMDGSISSTISYNANASVGAFGPSPMATAGGGATFSSTHSHSLKDFTFAQRSDSQMLIHEMAMTMTRDGTPYKDWNDLVPTIYDPFEGAKLRQPPDVATSNLALASQAVWMNNSPAGLVDRLDVIIFIRRRFCIVEATNEFGVLHAGSDVHDKWWTTVLPVNFAQLQ